MALLLETRDLTKRYDGRRALDRLTLSLAPGRILGLLGVNGAGKSTLLKIAAGQVHPDGGDVRLLGRRPGPATKSLVAYLPEVDCLWRDLSVRRTLDYYSTFFADWDQALAKELISFMGLDPGMQAGHLSRGMRARLKLVLVLARRAQLVLLDEPLSGIDPPSRARIVQAIVTHYRPERGSIVISTHEVAEAEGAFDDVVFIEEGRVKLAGAAEDLRQRHGRSLEQLFLEVQA